MAIMYACDLHMIIAVHLWFPYCHLGDWPVLVLHFTSIIQQKEGKASLTCPKVFLLPA